MEKSQGPLPCFIVFVKNYPLKSHEFHSRLLAIPVYWTQDKSKIKLRQKNDNIHAYRIARYEDFLRYKRILVSHFFISRFVVDLYLAGMFHGHTHRLAHRRRHGGYETPHWRRSSHCKKIQCQIITEESYTNFNSLMSGGGLIGGIGGAGIIMIGGCGAIMVG